MGLAYYVHCYDINSRKVKEFNVFNNIWVRERTIRELKKYNRAPSKYCYESIVRNQKWYGFEGLVEAIDRIIFTEEAYRCEYEMGVCDKFARSLNEIQHMDCYMQCKPNMEIIVRECLWQYRRSLKSREEL